MVTYLFIDKLRKPNGIVTCGDSATYPTIGGVQRCPRGSEEVGIVRLFP
jgi:hypothetical protein